MRALLLPIAFIISIAMLPTSLFSAEPKEIFVITKSPQVDSLSKKQIKQIYLEGGINIPLKAINLKSGNKYRSIFNAKIIGLTESRLQAYWAQMRFTGRASPPIEIEEISEILIYLENNPNHIAYLPASVELPEDFKVVFSLKY